MITNIAATAIIYPEDDPGMVFLEIKDDGYPLAAFRRTLCTPGGNWIGEAAKGDENPLETLRRELAEELSLALRPSPTQELVDLGFLDQGEAGSYLQKRAREASLEEKRKFSLLVSAIQERLRPYGDWVNVIPKSVLDRADSTNTRDGFTVLVSYWLCPLGRQKWEELAGFLEDFGNISNESIAVITTAGEMAAKDLKTAFGHDLVLRTFFQENGVMEGARIPIVEGVTSTFVRRTPLDSYEEYLKTYDVARKP